MDLKIKSDNKYFQKSSQKWNFCQYLLTFMSFQIRRKKERKKVNLVFISKYIFIWIVYKQH